MLYSRDEKLSMKLVGIGMAVLTYGILACFILSLVYSLATLMIFVSNFHVLLEFCRLLELKTEPQKGQWRDNSKSQGNPPGRTQMIIGANDDQEVWDESSDDKAPIDHNISKQDKPAVSSAGLQFASSLRGRNRSSWIFPSDSDSDEESICGQCREQALKAATRSI